MGFCLLSRRSVAAIAGTALALSVAPAVLAAPRSPAVPQAITAIKVYCSAPGNPAYAALPPKMIADITAKIAARPWSTEGIEITDNITGITCWYRSKVHFYAASVVKAIIISTLLRLAQEQKRSLTAHEKSLATLMITQSDNAAASALWNEEGPAFRQHFLNLAGMSQTKLAYAWGLSLLTADDEIRLLKLLTTANPVLTLASRTYILGLMAKVISSQRWGVPAGAPSTVVVHVKNGWLPYPGSQWEINSIGAFTRAATKTVPGRTYLMAMLTYNNPSMAYGVTTIESIAQVIHHDWNPGLPAVVPASRPGPGWGIPDEPVPPVTK